MDSSSKEDEENSQDESLFVRTEDEICLSSTIGPLQGKCYLSRKLGRRNCFVDRERDPDKEPCDAWKHRFIIEEAISVHAIDGWKMNEKSSNRKMLLYGQAIMISSFGKCLRCLSYDHDSGVSEQEKHVNYQIGYIPRGEEEKIDATCWFTIHPATKRQSGERVHAGDDVYLVNVATKRYLSIQLNQSNYQGSDEINAEENDRAVATFSPWSWTINLVSSGKDKNNFSGYLNGGEVIQIKLHNGKDECLSVPLTRGHANPLNTHEEKKKVCFESKSVSLELRSLWQPELFYVNFGGAFIQWGQPFRLLHLVTGLYLGIKEDRVVMVTSANADREISSFCFVKKSAPKKHIYISKIGMGNPCIKYGESESLLYHFGSDSYVGQETLGRLARRRRGTFTTGPPSVFLHHQPPQNTSLVVNRNYGIALSAILSHLLDTRVKTIASAMYQNDMYRPVSIQILRSSLMLFQEALLFLKPPREDILEPHNYQRELMFLRNRQQRMNNHGTVKMIFKLLKLMCEHYEVHPSPICLKIQHCLCTTLAAFVADNPTVSRDFANEKSLDSLMSLLNLPHLTHPMFVVFDKMLEISPEVIYSMTEKHVESLVKLLTVNGRERNIMKLLAKMCICQDITMRDKQQLVCKHLLKTTDLLVHPKLLWHINCFYANIFIDIKEKKDKWYFEFHWKPDKSVSKRHIRVGCATFHSFKGVPESNSHKVTEGGIGDDFNSIGFDGTCVWFGGNNFPARNTSSRYKLSMIRKQQSCQEALNDEDTQCIGFCYDSVDGTVWFTLNGQNMPLKLSVCSLDIEYIPDGEVFIVPAVSLSGGYEFAQLRFGGDWGSLTYKPPEGFLPLYTHEIGNEIQIRPFGDLGNKDTGHLKGPQIISGQMPFIPSVIDTSQVEFVDCMNELINKLASQMHGSWASQRIKDGWTYGDNIDYDAKTHPCLKPYNELDSGHNWVYEKAQTAVLTLAALGCNFSETLFKTELKYESEYKLDNGFNPKALVTVNELPTSLMRLVDGLAENLHNSWAEKKLEKGFRFGLRNNYQAKTYKNLVPFHSLEPEARKDYCNVVVRILKIIITLGYNVQLPTFDVFQNIEDTTMQVPFRTFRGQFYPYCTKSGKWQFSVKIIKGELMRVGWVTLGFPAYNIVGSDAFSYAIDGFRGYKWHNGNQEKCGHRWKVGDIVQCLLDLDRQTMSFVITDSQMRIPSREIVAFQGMDKTKWYIPAVTVFLSEEVEWNLCEMKGDKENVIAAGYEGIQTGIKSSIPVWYSDDRPVFEPIGKTSDKSLYTSQYTHNSITVNTTESVGKTSCFRLNMGVPMLSYDTSSSDGPEHADMCVSFSLVFPPSQDIENVYLGWCTPELAYLESLFNTKLSDSVYFSRTKCLTKNDRYTSEDNAWRIGNEYSTAFFVRLGALMGHNNPFMATDQENVIRVDCCANLTTGDMLFYCEGYPEEKITLHTDIPTKLFPFLVTTPSQKNVCEFVFTPVEPCLSIRSVVFGTNELLIKNDVVASMKIMHCSPASWHQMNINSNSSIDLESVDSGFTFPQFEQKRLLYILLPMEEKVIGFSELFESSLLANFHLETFDTLRACCMHDNIEAGREVRKLFTWEQLLYCIKSNHWDYNVRAAYFDLFNALHLEHEVNSHLMVQDDHIFAVESKSNHPSSPGSRRGSLSNTTLRNEISLDSIPHEFTYQFPVEELKNILFNFFERLMHYEIFTCRMLTSIDRANILRPLLVALDSLVVLRLVSGQQEMDRLLGLLHPVFSDKTGLKPHQALLTMNSNESIKLVLCDLLEHICHSQMQNRLEHIVKFAETFVGDLQDEQRVRVDGTEMAPHILQELNTPTEKQMETLLSFHDTDCPMGCPTNVILQKNLKDFHTKLIAHCGVPDDHVSAKDQLDEQHGTLRNIGNLVKLLCTSDRASIKKGLKEQSKIIQLQEIIKITLIKWSREGIKDFKLIEKAFLLLHRQFNETEELIKALGSTYVIEKMSEFCTDSIVQFRSSLGRVRNLLNTGMGEEEEKLLEKNLNALQHSSLFNLHPDLLRLAQVHLTVMNVIKSYLSFNTAISKKDFIRIRLERKRNMAISRGGFSGPVEQCCKFLQAFAKTSRLNQLALFEYIPYLLDQCCRHPDRMSSNTCNPLDVASAIIRDNLELVLALSEDTFKQVMVLMEKMTYGFSGNGTESDSDMNFSQDSSPLSSGGSSMSMEWSPFGSLKCLKFLYAAVWVNGETVSQNSSVIIKLLIQYPDSLGPGALGQNLGLVAIFRESMSILSSIGGPRRSSKLMHQETIVRFDRTRSQGSLKNKSPSMISLDSTTADITLAFYTFLVRLLACCASITPCSSALKTSTDHVVPFLQSLISEEDLDIILSFPLYTYNKQGLTPKQKQALLMFLDRVYGIKDHKYLLRLMKNVFYEDIRCNLYLCKDHQSKYALVDFYRYLCDFIMPFVQRHSHHLSSCTMEEMVIVTNFLKAAHLIILGGHLSSFHHKKVETMLVTVSKILPPKSFIHMIPEISIDLNVNSKSFITCVKTLTAHFEHYHGYYSQGQLNSSFNIHPPGRQQKIFATLLFYKLLKAASHKRLSDKPVIVQCLKALISAITPECFTPILSKSNIFLERISYHECITSCYPESSSTEEINMCLRIPSGRVKHPTVSETTIDVTIPTEVGKCIVSFAEHCHNLWVFEKQQVDLWMYGPNYSMKDRKDPNLKPYSALSDEHQSQLIKPIERCVKELLAWGYVFTHKRAHSQETVPIKQQIICLRVPKKKGVEMTDEKRYANFVPVVADYDKMQDKNETSFKVISEATAVVLNDLLHICDSHAHLPSTYNPLRHIFKGEDYPETCSFIYNLLKHFNVNGLLCCGAFNALPGHLTSRYSTAIKYAPFGQQLFETFLSSLTLDNSQETCHYLYPVIRHYLNSHASYYNPHTDSSESTHLYASVSEKIQIAKMLSQFLQFLPSQMDDVLVLPASKILQPITLEFLKEFNEVQLQNMISLSLSLLKALDVQQEEVMAEVGMFIQSVSGILEDFPSTVMKDASNECTLSDAKFLLYCLHCLIPVLATLFQQLNSFAASNYHSEVLSNYSMSVFNNLLDAVQSNTEVFIKTKTLTTVGKCLASFSLFHKCQSFIFGNSTEEMMEKLKWAAAKRFSVHMTAFVGSVIVPLLASTVQNSNDAEKNSLTILKLGLRMVYEYLGVEDTMWIPAICESLASLSYYCPSTMFSTHILPLISSLSNHAQVLWQAEQFLFSSSTIEDSIVQDQRQHIENIKTFSRDVKSVMLLTVKFANSRELGFNQSVGRHMIHDFVAFNSNILDYYYSSQRFSLQIDSNVNDERILHRSSDQNPLLVCAEMLLKSIPPVMHKLLDKVIPFFNQEKLPDVIEGIIEQQIVSDDSFKEHVDIVLDSSENNKMEVRRTNQFKSSPRLIRIMAYTKYYLFKSDRLSGNTLLVRGRWKTLMTRQKREAVLHCLKAVPFHRLKKHRAVYLFLNEYSRSWLSTSRESNMERLSERLLDQEDYETAVSKKIPNVFLHTHDPLNLLFSMFKMLASTDKWDEVNGKLYEEFCVALVQTTKWVVEDDVSKEGESAAKAYERYHTRLALAANKQKQLQQRGVPSLILSVLGASKGEMTPLVHVTIKLGLVLLEGGNEAVQKTMLDELTRMDSDVIASIKELVSTCCVLDWTSYERNYMTRGYDDNIAKRVFSSSDQVIDLFRFLQLLCEGHNEEFQNYLRTQNRNTAVNIVVATVDYLLKLQESVRDFYWHHAHHESLELPARECFLVSFQVARQVFRTLTEYIQGPCIGNQQSLSKSRLWDAVSGYLHIFTSLQHKLFAHISHIELLREVLDLEEEFFIFLLSMLEGNTMSSSIAHHMLNMLLENESYVMSLIKFYNIFIKLADTTTSNAFKEYDLNKDGFISYREFEKAMQKHQHYTKYEIDYLMQLADTNKDGFLDYKEFTNRFHQPAHNLGFHLCALVRQLMDILPDDPAVKKLVGFVSDLFEHFQGRMGCVEIIGKSSRVERVYFRIKESTSMQWEDIAIKESRKDFIYNTELTSQRDKLEDFVNFCENTIYEMNYNDTLAGIGQNEQTERAEKHRLKNYSTAEDLLSVNKQSNLMKICNPKQWLEFLISFLWTTLLFGCIINPVLQLCRFMNVQFGFLRHRGEGNLNSQSFLTLSKRIVYQQSTVTSYLPRIVYSFGSISSLLANSYYKIKKVLLVTTLLINVLILILVETDTYNLYMYKTGNFTNDQKPAMCNMKMLCFLMYTHFILSFMLIMSSYSRKGQLILFKEEKKTARRLEQQKMFTGPGSTLGFMDRLIIKSPSFPRYFWDKQVKERVLHRVDAEHKESVANILGMEVWSKFDYVTKSQRIMNLFYDIFDGRYQLWRMLVVMREPHVVYHFFYCFLSFAGLYINLFYFSIHLLDLMFQSKTLVTVLKSLKINIKQLIMTLAMTCAVLYIYAVIGFNFFRKFYQYEGTGGALHDNCDSMWNCFFFHLDKGLRSGGGIADVLVSAAGDQQYLLRLFFDMTFFFIVIVILLAVFQGLIIDAFGELRKKQDSVTDELHNKCFICGIGKNEFGSPQEFDSHIKLHHSMRDYMFLLMHLIGKPETEYTGQESHVWDQYVQQRWDFFPSGVCFQIQEKQRLLQKAANKAARNVAFPVISEEMNEVSRARRHPVHSKTVGN